MSMARFKDGQWPLTLAQIRRNTTKPKKRKGVRK